jgi:hypothetical protein
MPAGELANLPCCEEAITPGVMEGLGEQWHQERRKGEKREKRKYFTIDVFCHSTVVVLICNLKLCFYLTHLTRYREFSFCELNT